MTSEFKHVAFDIETDGLLHELTKLHSLVIRDIDTLEVISCGPPGSGYKPFKAGLEVLAKAERIYAHNGIRFDAPALEKLTGFRIPMHRLMDTMVVAGFRWSNMKELDSAREGYFPSHLIGRHTLEAWGYRLGVLKGDFGNGPTKKKPRHKKTEEELAADKAVWAEWTPEMQEYCEQDTLVTAHLVRQIRKAGFTPPLALEIEQKLCAYLDKQHQNGWPFNIEDAAKLQGKLAARREEILQELQEAFPPWYRSAGLFTPKRDNKRLGYVAGVEVEKVELVVFNPGSRQQIADRLQKVYGWKPTEFTPSGQPKIDEGTLLALPQHLPGVALLNEYLVIGKLLGQLAEGDSSWMLHATADRETGGRMTGLIHIHHGVMQSGTITHRAAHIAPNLGQVPKVGSFMGEECRSLFTVPAGWVQVGCDASGLELRELAHFMARYDNGAYGKVIIEGDNALGTDIHSVNRDALGLTGKEGRDAAKTFIYAFLYGSGDLNLGRLLGCSDEEVAHYKTKAAWKKTKARLKKRGEGTDDYTVACALKGADLRARFLKNLPALSDLIDAVKKQARAKGYLLIHDGRRVPVRHQHAALNSLLQACGSIVCKLWIVQFSDRLTAEFGEQGWDGKWAALGWIHDEVQLAVRPEIESRVKEILVEEIRKVGVELNLRIALDGEAKSGPHWAATH